MGDVLNLVTEAAAEKLTTNRHGKKEHLTVYFLPDEQVVLEAWEDHKYIFWLSKTKLSDKTLNGEIYELVSKGDYDYVAYDYKLIPELKVGGPIADFFSVEISMNAMTGNAFGEYLIKTWEETRNRCLEFEKDPAMQRRMKEIGEHLAQNPGTSKEAYRALHKDLEDIWKWTFLKLSPNSELRGLYRSYARNLSNVYNREMDRIR